MDFSHFPVSSFKLGLDLQGGSHLVYEADLSKIESDGQGEAMEGLRDVIERRVNLFGVGEPVVRVQEQDNSQRLVVELPGIQDVQEAINAIGKTPYLEFKKERPEEEREAMLAELEELEATATEEAQARIEEILEENPYFIPTSLTGQYLSKAEVQFDQTTFEPEVILEFNNEGKELFKEITSNNINKRLAIYIDGIAISAPVVQEAIPNGVARITGQFGIEEAKELARNLNAGALPVPIELISQKTVGPTLGKISLEQSLKAGFLGFVLIIIFMILFYRLSGLLASLALVIYLAILLSLFKLIPVTLTLAGIGGVILSLGMAVDANVLIFERIKEELRGERSFQSALKIGFNRAWPSIRDSNLTTIIVAFIMFFFGTSFIKGFALTLSLGIVISMFSAMFITRSFMSMFVGTKLEKIKWIWG
jgi:protein-export membrane protein SecD